MDAMLQSKTPALPILLFDDECGVCRYIAHWVKGHAYTRAGVRTLIVRPIGNDPEDLKILHPGLDIWEAYATIHALMPDGSMRLGGEAVAVVFNAVPATWWFRWVFAIRLLGYRPFQPLLNLAYVVLADVRPLLGCASCGTVRMWVKPLKWLFRAVAMLFGTSAERKPATRSTVRLIPVVSLPVEGEP